MIETETALAAIVSAIVDTIRDTPEGVPSGILYAGLMSVLSLDAFTRIVDALVNVGMVNRRGLLLTPGDRINGIA